jgi:glycosyltransferase involved in cell wall biosynthesis
MQLVSVIVPIYNVESYLDQCIKSIIDQEYSKIEIILINDGSTDKSGRICDKYAKIDKRIKVIHQNNRGHGPACNAGIANANGTYLCFCDGDDYFFPETIKRLVKTIEKHKTKVACCTAYAFDNDTDTVSTDPYHVLFRIPKLHSTDVLTKQDLIENASNLSVRHWDKIYNLAWLKNKKVLFPEMKTSYNDVPFHWLIISKVSKIAIIREQLYAYRLNRAGASCYQIKQKEYFNIRILTLEIIKKQKPELLDEFYKLFIIDMNWLKNLEKPIQKQFNKVLQEAFKNKKTLPQTKNFIANYFEQKSKKYLLKKKIKEILKIIFFN